MQGRNILRTFFFCAFFGIGAAALSGSVLCDVLLKFYRSELLLHAQQQRTKDLKSLIADYNALLTEIEKDPNFVRRIAPATLGTEPDDADTIYPRATFEQLEATRKILTDDSNQQLASLRSGSNESAVPRWLTRCSEPRRRITLFVAGAFLILVAFVCFGPAGQKNQPEQ